MLFRLGEEKARATSIVRYAPGSHFSRHGHPGGEEFLVLEGSFQDETGDFPTGTYVCNPPGTGHAPGSTEGCTIFVRLWQFAADDQERVVSAPGGALEEAPRRGVLWSQKLFSNASERVVVEQWAPGADLYLANPAGLELLVLEGGFSDGSDDLARWSWLRLPPGEPLAARAGAMGARVWYKSAPLLHANVSPFEGEPSAA
jgi:anti-sigma factor ChrR (cupin superfamily)